MCRGDLWRETLPNFQAWVEQVGRQREGYFAKKPSSDTLTAATFAKVTWPACVSLHNMCAPDNDNDKQKKSKMMFYFLAHIKVYTWSEFVVYEK